MKENLIHRRDAKLNFDHLKKKGLTLLDRDEKPTGIGVCLRCGRDLVTVEEYVEDYTLVTCACPRCKKDRKISYAIVTGVKEKKVKDMRIKP